MKNILIVLLFVAASSKADRAELVSFHELGPVGLKPCIEQVKEMTHTFEKQPGIKVAYATAYENGKGFCHFEIDYYSSLDIHPQLSLFAFGAHAQSYGNHLNSIKTCVASLSQQVALYKKATGTSPFLATCHQRVVGAATALWGFQPKRSLHNIHFAIYPVNQKVTEVEEALKWLEHWIERNGGVVAAIEPNYGALFYYRKVPLPSFQLGFYTGMSEWLCQVQKKDIQERLSEIGASPLASGCVHRDNGESHFPRFHNGVLVFTSRENKLRYETLTFNYPNVSDCLSDRARITKMLQEEGRRGGAFCTQVQISSNESVLRMQTFEVE